jgi:predicted metal-dependent enzyme (double-stranded beta helix superfamily)
MSRPNVLNLLNLADQISAVLPDHPEKVIGLLQTYAKTKSTDWHNYAQFSPTHYTRNPVTRTSKCELIVMGWQPNQSTFIHDHGTSDCWMLVLSGHMNETVYAVPDDPDVKYDIEMRPIISADYSIGEVGHISNQVGIHEIGTSGTQSVTLHVYAPPLEKIRLYRRSNDETRLELDSIMVVSSEANET